MSKQNIYTFLRGMVMGTAEGIPGVSGSTLALAMGIYDDFLNFLHDISHLGKILVSYIIRRSNFLDLKKSFFKVDWIFGITLGLGMVTALGLFSRVIKILLEDYQSYLFAYFFGLVVASTLIPWNEIKVKNWKIISIIAVSAILTFILLGLKPLEDAQNPSATLLFFGGIVGVSGLILPGVSGSFILLMLGLYEYILGIVKDLTSLNFSKIGDLLIFSAGLIIGFVFFVRFMKWLLKKYPDMLLASLIGIMFGSLRVLYPFIEESEVGNLYKYPWEQSSYYNFLVVLALIFAGKITILLLSKVSKEKNV